MSEMFQPIVTPLQTLVDTSRQQKIKTEPNVLLNQVKPEIKPELREMKKNESSQFNVDNHSICDSITSEQDTNDHANSKDTLMSDDLSYMGTSTPVKQSDSLFQYLDMLEHQHKDMDKRYGVRQKHGKLFFGDSQIDFDNNIISVKDGTYTQTAGLIELLFKKTPRRSLITQNDKTNYVKMTTSTNAHKKRYTPEGSFYINQTVKFDDYIAKHINAPGESEGKGLPNLMTAFNNRAKTDYVYWDDPNEFVDRLRLLIASQAAWNPNHSNEIISIIEELREAGIIY